MMEQTNSIQQIIEREAEDRSKSQWCKESDEYARESVKGYVEPQKGACYYERALGYEDGVESGFKQGANFALGLDRWIPVSQGLPEEGQEVYAVHDGKYQYSAIFTKGKFEFAQIEIGNVTHWMPQLPPPQK